MRKQHPNKRAGARASAPRTRKKKAPKLSAVRRPRLEEFVGAAKVESEGPAAAIRPERSSRRRGGRPSSYRPEFAHIARALCRRGATDYDLAEEFGVTTVTIWRWSATNDEFCNALKEGKDAFDDRVERSLAQRAIGYTYHTEKLFNFQGRIIRAETVEHVPPDAGAAKLWLCNRRPHRWRDKRELEKTGPGGGPSEAPEMSDLEVARRVAFLLARGVEQHRARSGAGAQSLDLDGTLKLLTTD